ncbi:MAG TPA: TadE family protein, partial [Thermoguttaceae bacterium]|nr:TadE family protein [Thermoguttaceae bacterium]
MRSKRNHPRKETRCGAAAVELALILIPLTTLVLGAIDFGRFAHGYIAVTNAARAGAGFASMHGVTTTTLPVWELRTREAVVTE